jgi:hypothetical protein
MTPSKSYSHIYIYVCVCVCVCIYNFPTTICKALALLPFIFKSFHEFAFYFIMLIIVIREFATLFKALFFFFNNISSLI